MINHAEIQDLVKLAHKYAPTQARFQHHRAQIQNPKGNSLLAQLVRDKQVDPNNVGWVWWFPDEKETKRMWVAKWEYYISSFGPMYFISYVGGYTIFNKDRGCEKDLPCEQRAGQSIR